MVGQIGTPDEPVISPATDYVGEFTCDIPRAKVLSARSLAPPISCTPADPARVSAMMALQALAPRFSDQTEDVVVLDAQGRPIRVVPRHAAVDVTMVLRGS